MKNIKALLILNFTVVYFVWGMTFIWMKMAASELHPFVIIFWQNFIAAIALIILNRKYSFLDFVIKNYASIITQSFFMLVCGVSFITISVDKLPASFAAIIISSVPVWVAVFNGVSEKNISLRKLVGIALGFLGLIGLLYSESQVILENYFHLIILIIAAISWSFGLFRMAKLPIVNSPYLSSASQMLFASFIYLVLIIFFVPSPKFISTNPTTVGAILSLALLGSTIAYSSFNWLLKNSSPVKVSTYAYVNPIISIFMAMVLLGEKFNLNQVPFIVVILIAVFIVVTESTSRNGNESN